MIYLAGRVLWARLCYVIYGSYGSKTNFIRDSTRIPRRFGRFLLFAPPIYVTLEKMKNIDKVL